jgi:AraC-like DNA-binding protein
MDVECAGDHEEWSEQELTLTYRLVLPRRGMFVRRVGRQEMVLDPGVAYFARPGTPQQVAHPRPGGDACTVIALPEQLVSDLTGDDLQLPDSPVFTDGRLDLAQRALMARLKSGASGDFEAAEQAILLTARVLEQWRPHAVQRGRPSTAMARQRLVDHARQLLAADPSSIRLTTMASILGVSPHHLSRIFHQETGQTLARYRNRLRVRLALDRIEGGERNLAGLAADLGFSDHAHLTRTVRSEVGTPPIHVYSVLQTDESAERRL